MKIAITGASGFVGSLALTTLKNDRYDAFALKRPWKLSKDIDVLIHCAAYIPSSYDDELEAEKCMMDNTISTLKLMIEAEKHNVKKFVYLSSGQIYKWKDIPPDEEIYTASEESPIGPTKRASPYLISKTSADFLVQSHKGKMQKVILRPSSIYGSGMKPVGVIHRLLKKIRNGESIDMKNEDYQIDLVHVEDVVSMIKNSAGKECSTIYNVGGGNPISIAVLAKIIADAIGVKITISNKSLCSGHPSLNIDKAFRDFNYKPKRLKDTLEYYVKAIL